MNRANELEWTAMEYGVPSSNALPAVEMLTRRDFPSTPVSRIIDPDAPGSAWQSEMNWTAPEFVEAVWSMSGHGRGGLTRDLPASATWLIARDGAVLSLVKLRTQCVPEERGT